MMRLLTFLTRVEKDLKESLAVYQDALSLEGLSLNAHSKDGSSLNTLLQERYLLVSIAEQKLYLIQRYKEHSKVLKNFPVSTAKKGVGCKEGSEQTPLGVHRIAQKIGSKVPEGTLFKARKNTGQVLIPLTEKGTYSDIDAITSRILWLDGMEIGKNKGGNVDSFRRYIYIHGTNEEWRLGTPVSHGCIRMSNQAIIELYDTVSVNTLVVII